MRYVIIGSSAAGVNAVRELRRLCPDAEISKIAEMAAGSCTGRVDYNWVYEHKMPLLKEAAFAFSISECDKSAYKAFCKAGLRDVMIRLYPEGRHEMLNEINKAQVCQDILNWLKEKVG